MPESVIRGTKKGFTVLYNSALRDERLSLKTIGLFAVMQGRAGDGVWQLLLYQVQNAAELERL